MSNTYDLQRFRHAQNQFGQFERALGEIMAGRKESHWIWYVFPQLKGLGKSYNSEYFGLAGAEEAAAYWEDEILSQRLKTITEAFLALEGKSAEEVPGGIDAKKVHSSMTLFDVIHPDSLFRQVLVKYYDGKGDRGTLHLWGRSE